MYSINSSGEGKNPTCFLPVKKEGMYMKAHFSRKLVVIAAMVMGLGMGNAAFTDGFGEDDDDKAPQLPQCDRPGGVAGILFDCPPPGPSGPEQRVVTIVDPNNATRRVTTCGCRVTLLKCDPTKTLDPKGNPPPTLPGELPACVNGAPKLGVPTIITHVPGYITCASQQRINKCATCPDTNPKNGFCDPR